MKTSRLSLIVILSLVSFPLTLGFQNSRADDESGSDLLETRTRSDAIEYALRRVQTSEARYHAALASDLQKAPELGHQFYDSFGEFLAGDQDLLRWREVRSLIESGQVEEEESELFLEDQSEREEAFTQKLVEVISSTGLFTPPEVGQRHSTPYVQYAYDFVLLDGSGAAQITLWPEQGLVEFSYEVEDDYFFCVREIGGGGWLWGGELDEEKYASRWEWNRYQSEVQALRDLERGSPGRTIDEIIASNARQTYLDAFWNVVGSGKDYREQFERDWRSNELNSGFNRMVLGYLRDFWESESTSIRELQTLSLAIEKEKEKQEKEGGIENSPVLEVMTMSYLFGEGQIMIGVRVHLQELFPHQIDFSADHDRHLHGTFEENDLVIEVTFDPIGGWLEYVGNGVEARFGMNGITIFRQEGEPREGYEYENWNLGLDYEWSLRRLETLEADEDFMRLVRLAESWEVEPNLLEASIRSFIENTEEAFRRSQDE